MKRWNKNQSKDIEYPAIDDFLKEIIEICKKYNFSISHEDRHGGFEIELYDEKNIDWLLEASVNF